MVKGGGAMKKKICLHLEIFAAIKACISTTFLDSSVNKVKILDG